MPTPVFTWQVSANTSVNTNISTLEAQFEGYRQIAENGINAIEDIISVDVSPIEIPESEEIYAFLRAQRGMPFLWTPMKPLEQVERLWTCIRFGFKRQGGLIIGVTAEFKNFNSP